MKLPFTIEQFLETLKNYNTSVWPLQIAFYLIALIAIFFAIKNHSRSTAIILFILSFFWLWMGIFYHLLFFTEINKAAYFFGTMFITQSVLFIVIGVLKNRMRFQFRPDIYGITGILLILFALILYPIIGYFQGHIYPYSPTFGLPCPTTIFTFAMFLWTDRKFPSLLIIIPLLWSVIGFSASFTLGIREDIGLLISGIITFALLIIRNKRMTKNN